MFWPSAYFYNGAGNWCFNRPYMGFLLGKIIKFLFMVWSCNKKILMISKWVYKSMWYGYLTKWLLHINCGYFSDIILMKLQLHPQIIIIKKKKKHQIGWGNGRTPWAYVSGSVNLFKLLRGSSSIVPKAFIGMNWSFSNRQILVSEVVEQPRLVMKWFGHAHCQLWRWSPKL
jgi:hypothetical protein